MKSNSKTGGQDLKAGFNLKARVLALALAAAGFAFFVGCQSTSIPSSTSGGYSNPSSVNNTSLIANCSILPLRIPNPSGGSPPLIPSPPNQPPFGPVTSTAGTFSNPATINFYPINASLFELKNPPTYQIASTVVGPPGSGTTVALGAITLINNFKTLASGAGDLEGPGPTGAPYDYAFHEAGAVTDLGDFEYPALDLQAQFEAGQFYDASIWKGVKFLMKVGPNDTAPHRTFAIPVYQTQAVPGGGGCTAGPRLCYDHFAADYSAGTAGQWKQFSYLFSDLHQLVSGAIPNPPTLSGVNLQQVLWLQWEEGRNNSPGTCGIDLWIDDVEFY